MGMLVLGDLSLISLQEATCSKAPGQQVLWAEEKKSLFPAEKDAVCQSLVGVRLAELFCIPCASQAEGAMV